MKLLHSPLFLFFCVACLASLCNAGKGTGKGQSYRKEPENEGRSLVLCADQAAEIAKIMPVINMPVYNQCSDEADFDTFKVMEGDISDEVALRVYSNEACQKVKVLIDAAGLNNCAINVVDKPLNMKYDINQVFVQGEALANKMKESESKKNENESKKNEKESKKNENESKKNEKESKKNENESKKNEKESKKSKKNNKKNSTKEAYVYPQGEKGDFNKNATRTTPVCQDNVTTAVMAILASDDWQNCGRVTGLHYQTAEAGVPADACTLPSCIAAFAALRDVLEKTHSCLVVRVEPPFDLFTWARGVQKKCKNVRMLPVGKDETKKKEEEEKKKEEKEKKKKKKNVDDVIDIPEVKDETKKSEKKMDLDVEDKPVEKKEEEEKKGDDVKSSAVGAFQGQGYLLPSSAALLALTAAFMGL